MAPTPRRVLAIASLGAAVAFVDATIVNIAFPNIAQSFSGTSIASLSWVLNAYNIVFAAFLVAAGRIADLLGRRRMFVFGLEVFTAASLLCAVAPSAGALIAFRVVQALGAALLVPASLALVLNAFPPDRRAHGVALLSAVRRRPPGWDRRWAGSWSSAAELAAGVPGQPPDRRSRPWCSPAVSWSRAAPRDGGGCPTCSGRCCSRSRSRRSCSAS